MVGKGPREGQEDETLLRFGAETEHIVSKSSPARRAINEHMHRHHGGAALAGDTQARIVQHDLVHAEGDDRIAGAPLHYHEFDESETWEKYLEPIVVEE